jgi:hypothetical protein
VEESLGDLPASVSVSQKDLTAITRRHPLRHFFKGLNLLPNSFATGFGGPSLGFETSVKNVHTYEERERSQLPAFVAATAIRRIQHRYQYDTFDTSGDWFGYLLVNYIDSYAKWTPVKDPSAFNPDAVPAEERYDYIVEGMVVGPVIGYEVAVYSPLGTYGIGLGFGLGISGLRDSFQERRWKGHFLTVVSINYRAFITDRLFSTLTFSLYGASPNLISNDHFDIGGRGYFLLGLGYYFPESSSMARKIL